MRGMPQVYSGDEIAMQGGPDPDNRRNFPGGFGGEHDAFSPRPHTGGAGHLCLGQHADCYRNSHAVWGSHMRFCKPEITSRAQTKAKAFSSAKRLPVRDGTALLVLVNPHGFGLYRMR